MSSKFDGGVRYYTTGKATVIMPFPEQDICCQNCKLMIGEYITRRSRCALTGEIIPDPEYMIGHDCPLKFVEKESNDESDCKQ